MSKSIKEKQPKTLSVSQLIRVLKRMPQSYKVYLSRDEEGNGYGTIESDQDSSLGGSFSVCHIDNCIVIYPWIENLDDEEITPNQMKQIHGELEKEHPELYKPKELKLEINDEIKTKDNH